MDLIDNLIKEGWLKTPQIIEAFRKIKRADFMPENMKDLAEVDEAMPIGQGQTISQPKVVAFMLELLEPKAGEKILDVGSGSGWTSALLSEIVGKKGRVVSLELIPELKEFGEKNAAKYGFVEKGTAQFICCDGSKGYEEESPFDKILASAALAAARGGKEDLSSLSTARHLPQAWKKQLKVGGRIVAPINSSIWLFVKKSENEMEEKEYPGFIFVPLIEE